MILAALLLIGPVVVEYDNATLPALWQSPFGWAPLDRHPGELGAVSNPNWHHTRATGQWRVPEGTLRVRGLSLSRWLSVPDGAKVVTWQQRERHADGSGSQIVRRWKFPTGTVSGEKLYVNNRPWLTRTRTLEPDGMWSPDVEQHTDDPPGYEPSAKNCIDCHRDAGRHVTRLPGHRTVGRFRGDGSHDGWYGFLRGGGEHKGGGVFSWRPVDSRGNVLPKFRHIVEVRR